MDRLQAGTPAESWYVKVWSVYTLWSGDCLINRKSELPWEIWTYDTSPLPAFHRLPKIFCRVNPVTKSLVLNVIRKSGRGETTRKIMNWWAALSTAEKRLKLQSAESIERFRMKSSEKQWETWLFPLMVMEYLIIQLYICRERCHTERLRASKMVDIEVDRFDNQAEDGTQKVIDLGVNYIHSFRCNCGRSRSQILLTSFWYKCFHFINRVMIFMLSFVDITSLDGC